MPGTWAGGTTSAIFAYPPETIGAPAHAQLWVGTAVIDRAAAYSCFPGRLRIHLPIHGNGIRLHFQNPAEVVALSTFAQHHFDGARPLRVTLVPRQDGDLDVMLRGPHAPSQTLTAVRPAEARAKGLPSPSVFTGHTTMKNPDEPLRFSFPDLSGKLVSNTDPQFRNKVLVVNITGSWCPNCVPACRPDERARRQNSAAGALERVADDVLHRSRWQGARHSYGLRGACQRGVSYAVATGIRGYGRASPG